MAENKFTIEDMSYEDAISTFFLDYSVSVITDRALADVRDGLKPVQRRILHTLMSLGKSDAPFRKCARIVGDTMGKYHPHGDSSIYEGLVNLSQSWKTPIPLADPHGNFGSVSGDSAAAMRYTECRSSKYLEAILRDVRYFKDEYVDNFDSTEKEPVVLPMLIPNLLVNGTSGIAVGMAANIPSHNLAEIIDSYIMYLNDPKVSLDEILSVMQGPDFATGGIINSSYENIRSIYETGTGKIKVRGKVEIRNADFGRRCICVTEIPYTMISKTEAFIKAIQDVALEYKLSSIVDVYDRGDKNGECICIECKRGTTDEEIDNILATLYKKTGLEDSYAINMLYLSDGEPKVGGILDIYKLFTEYKKQVYNKKYQMELAEQQDIFEVQTGLIEAVDCIDLIIEILRGSKNVSDAKNCLMFGDTSKIKFRFEGSEADAKLLRFTEKQANAILGMRLQRLIGLELDALRKELKNSEKKMKEYQKLLSAEKYMIRKMVEDLEELKANFGIPRRSVIQDCGEVVLKKIEQPASELVVLVDRFYYVKAVPVTTYEKNEEKIQTDYRFAIRCFSNQRIGVFADDNQMYMLKVDDILKMQIKKSNTNGKKGASMLGKLTDKGVQLFEFCKMNGNEEILYVGCMEDFIQDRFIFVTKNGMAKVVEGSNFDSTRKVIGASKPGEQMVYISTIGENDFIVAKSKDGYYTRVLVEEYMPKGKGAGCTKFMNLTDNDEIDQAMVGTTKDAIVVDGVEVSFTRIKTNKKGAKGSKLRL